MTLLWYTLATLVLACSAQKIVTRPKTITVVEQTLVELPCYIEDLAEGDSIIWKRGEDPLFVDDDQLVTDDRYFVTREGSNSTLTIKSAEPIDNTDYTCAITEPEIDIKHKVIVHSRPIVIVSPDQSIYDITVGDANVVIRCHGKGNPTPTIKWERKDGPLPDGVSVRHQQLVISKAERIHSGEYSCTAKNVAGSDTASLNIRVNEPLSPDAIRKKPWVRMEPSFIPVAVGQEVTLACSYEGLPAPIAEWFFNGYKINFSEARFKNAAQFATRESNHSINSLIIRSMTEETFGDYMCRASNNLGSAQAVIHVSGRPGPPVLTLDESVLSFEVRAQQPVLEYRIYYRQEKQDDWAKHESFRPKKGDKNGVDSWAHEVNLKPLLEPGVKYHVQVKARNAIGWGSFAKDYVIVQIPIAEPETAAASSLSALSVVVVALVVRGF